MSNDARNKEFEVEISRSDGFDASTSATLELPATWVELNDALEKARITHDNTPYSATLIDAKRPYLEDALTDYPSVNLYALNFFAEQLSEIKGEESYVFEGLVKMEATGPVSVERLINLTRGITDTLVAAISTDKELQPHSMRLIRSACRSAFFIVLKALLEAAECENVFDALNLAQNLDSYNFNAEIADPSAYAKSVLGELEIPKKDMLFAMTDLHGYGRLLMAQNDMHITEYGLISSKDGGPIIAQEQDSMSQTMA